MADRQSIEEIKKKVEQRVAQEAGSTVTPDPSQNNGHVPGKFVRDCLHANALGDGMLYCELHKKRYVMNKTTGDWMIFNGQHWDRDILDQAIAAVEDVASRYLEEARNLVGEIDKAIKKGNKKESERLQHIQNNIYKRVLRLRGDTGRTSCIKFAHTNPDNALAVDGKKFDTNPWLLACANGVIDLLSGSFREGKPDDWLFRASPVMWQGIDAPAKLWEKSILEIFDGSEEMAAFLRRLCGYAVTGLTTEHILPILWGDKGFNGKSTIVETIKLVMGPLAAPIPSELFLQQWRPVGSSGPSPDIMALRGLRVAFGSETEQGRKFSASKMKWLSGDDTLVGRNPYDKDPTYFKPTHTLFLMTNNRPSAPPDDNAFWERIILIPFRLSFVNRKPAQNYERMADSNLKEKLKNEQPGILAWLVRGCLEWQKHGLTPPVMVLEETANYHRSEDNLTDFIEDCCELDPSYDESSTNLYEAFSQWWVKNINKDKKRVPSHKAFGQMMSKRFYKEKRGTYRYFGLRLKFGVLDDLDD